MNPLVILVPVLVVLAIVVVVASARRRDSGDAIGALARETVNKDRGEPSVLGQIRRARSRQGDRDGRCGRSDR